LHRGRDGQIKEMFDLNIQEEGCKDTLLQQVPTHVTIQRILRELGKKSSMSSS
jgi:hypothetical protein